jgi:hypothetical protein
MYKSQTWNADLKGQVQTTGYLQALPNKDKCCPYCGRCPHCGQPTPSVPPSPFIQPYTYPYITMGQTAGTSGVTGAQTIICGTPNGGGIVQRNGTPNIGHWG